MFVTPETFRNQLDCLIHDFRILSLQEAVDRLLNGRSLPAKACALTFDDGWIDNYEHAFPALTERSLPATVFLVTKRIGQNGGFWPDETRRRLTALQKIDCERMAESLGIPPRGSDLTHSILTELKHRPPEARERWLDGLRAISDDPQASDRQLLNWSEVAAMASDGIDFEPHGTGHEILVGLSRERIERELRDSLSDLRERGYAAGCIFAYPSGAEDSNIRQLAARCGYRAAFGTEFALTSHESDPMCLPRVGIHDDVSNSRASFRYRLARAAKWRGSIRDPV
jgi:peptidoglycan/xylan/chitin deacetylase (PgdA/CDA1 family)